MLQWLIAGSSLTIGSILLTAFWLLKSRQVTEVKGEFAPDRFSGERYEPMHRLLSVEDMEFLKRRAGLRPDALAQLKRDRIRIFKLYLGELSGDFQRLHSQVRLLVAEAPGEYAELVHVVMKQQVRFRLALAGVRFRLALYQAGIGHVDISRVLDPIRMLHEVILQTS